MANSLLLIFTVAAVVIGTANATPTAAPPTICNVKFSELAVCLPAIAGKSPRPPTKKCCSVMGKANLHCLCNYKSDFVKYGIDPAHAMALPPKCGRKLPRECNKALH